MRSCVSGFAANAVMEQMERMVVKMSFLIFLSLKWLNITELYSHLDNISRNSSFLNKISV